MSKTFKILLGGIAIITIAGAYYYLHAIVAPLCDAVNGEYNNMEQDCVSLKMCVLKPNDARPQNNKDLYIAPPAAYRCVPRFPL